MHQTFSAPDQGRHSAARAALLRAELSRIKADGFLIPRADAHMGEYVAPRDERLAWISGFTGSAGAAVVMQGKAAVFVDGRYTLQAADQVDTDVFTVIPMQDLPLSKWLAEHAPQATIAYDPWLHGTAEIERLQKSLRQEMKPIANPIDAVWSDQPPPPTAPIRIQPKALAGRSGADKLAALSNGLAADDLAATVLTLPDSIAWLMNIRGGDIPRNPVPLVFAIVRSDGRAILFAAESQISEEVAAHLGPNIIRADPDTLLAALDRFAGQTVSLDRDSCPLAIVQRLQSAGATLHWAPDPCIMPKAQKTKAELAGARAAHARDGAAMARFLHWLDEEAPKSTLTEIDIVKRLEAERRATNQLLDISFDTISGSGPNGAIVHYRVSEASNRTLTSGEVMLVDSGGQYQDGTTDITRTLATGPVPEGAARAYTLVLKGMIALSSARFPDGTTGRDLDILARAALWRAGLDYAHGTGHGVGAYLCVHEGPARIARTGEIKLAPGMILSNEPGYYREGAFGIRIENLLVVTAAETPPGGDRPMMAFETLTLAPIDTRLIDRALLSDDEAEWLNTYHARVLAEIGPQVSGGDLDWLKAACAPI